MTLLDQGHVDILFPDLKLDISYKTWRNLWKLWDDNWQDLEILSNFLNFLLILHAESQPILAVSSVAPGILL